MLNQTNKYFEGTACWAVKGYADAQDLVVLGELLLIATLLKQCIIKL